MLAPAASELGDPQGFADHQGPREQEHEHQRVEDEGSRLQRAEGQRLADPARQAHAASTAVNTTLVGIGVPSKYGTFAEPAAIVSAVTL